MPQSPSDDPDREFDSETTGTGTETTPLAGSGLDTSADAVLSVAEFNTQLGTHIEDNCLDFDYVIGDISDCSQARSGHTYFDLTGDEAAISCALWSYQSSRVTTDPENGVQVAVAGDLSFYEPHGSITLVVDDVIPLGESEYARERAKIREQLAAEGLLAAEKKQPLPGALRRIAVVTSADSDARADAVRSIHDKHPGVDIVVQDASVQGEEALPSLMTAIETVDRDPEIDLIVVTRGGGADATLRVFDDLALCKTVAEAETPTVVGIGHEQDRPLVDEVADHRVMTPTDVGDVIPDRDARLDDVATLDERLTGAFERAVTEELVSRRDQLAEAHASLAAEELNTRADALDAAHDRLVRSRLENLGSRLDRAYGTTVTARLSRLANDLDAALARCEQAAAFEAEKETFVSEAQSTIRRQRLLIAALGLLVVALTAYIIYT